MGWGRQDRPLIPPFYDTVQTLVFISKEKSMPRLEVHSAHVTVGELRCGERQNLLKVSVSFPSVPYKLISPHAPHQVQRPSHLLLSSEKVDIRQPLQPTCSPLFICPKWTSPSHLVASSPSLSVDAQLSLLPLTTLASSPSSSSTKDYSAVFLCIFASPVPS